jgi:hypothetical protein
MPSLDIRLQYFQRIGETMSEPAKNERAYVLATAAYNYGAAQAKELLTTLVNELGMKIGYLKSPIR